MKKLLALLLCALLALTALCACESDKKSKDDDDESIESSESAESSESSESDDSDVADDESSDASDDESTESSDVVSDVTSDDVSDTSSEPEQSDISLIGTWTSTVDIASVLIGEGTDALIPCNISMTFTDAEVSVTMEYTQSAEELAAVMLAVSYEIAGGEAVMSYEDFLALVDMDEMIASAEEMIASGKEPLTTPYTLEGNKLTMEGDSVCTIAVNGNEMTFTDIQAADGTEVDDETLGMLKSSTFTKVA